MKALLSSATVPGGSNSAAGGTGGAAGCLIIDIKPARSPSVVIRSTSSGGYPRWQGFFVNAAYTARTYRPSGILASIPAYHRSDSGIPQYN